MEFHSFYTQNSFFQTCNMTETDVDIPAKIQPLSISTGHLKKPLEATTNLYRPVSLSQFEYEEEIRKRDQEEAQAVEKFKNLGEKGSDGENLEF